MAGEDNAGTDAPENEDINTGADTGDQNDDLNIEDQDDAGEDIQDDDSDLDKDKGDSGKKEPKKDSSKNATIKQLRDENKKLKAEKKAEEEAKMKADGELQKLLDIKQKELDEALPKAANWDAYEEKQGADFDKEIVDLEKKVGKDILREKDKMLGSFSDNLEGKALKIDYLKDLSVAKGKASYKGSPDGGAGVDKLSGKQIMDKYEGTPNGLGKALLAKAKSK